MGSGINKKLLRQNFRGGYILSDQLVHTKIIKSLSYDPWYNLALEEHLLNQVGENEITLYLWQNQNTVVIGKHQNAWKECRWDLLNNEGGKLARRLSGGGAVFHDLGNLNFTFVMNRKLYDLTRQLQVILQAVRSFSINAEFSGRNDLVVEGKKFSGNAFCFRTRSAYHHGCILLNADFGKLSRYLQVSREKIVSKGVDSVQSRVVNLAELNPEITVDGLAQSLVESFISIYGGNPEDAQIDPATFGLDALYKKYSSWDWLFGETPNFDISFENRFSWGGIEVGFRLKNGIVAAAKIYSDAMNEGLIEELSKAWPGCIFQKEVLIRKLDELCSDVESSQMIKDIQHWLETKQI